MQTKFIVFLIVLSCMAMPFANADEMQTAGPPFEMMTERDAVFLSSDAESFVFSLYIRMPEGHFLYRDKTQIDIHDDEGALEWQGVDWPPTESREDPFLNKTVAVWDTEDLELPLRFGLVHRDQLPTLASGVISLQGCSESICYRPIKLPFEFRVAQAAGTSEIGRGKKPAPTPVSNSVHGLERLFSENLPLAVAVAFMGGVVTDFTPCVLPLIPLILLFIGVQRQSHWTRNLALSVALVLGMSITYIVLGLFAVLLSWNLGFIFQRIWFQGILALFFIVMALALWEKITLALPAKWQTRLSQVGGKGFRGSLAAGLTIGFIALPCVGPVIAALLLYVGTSRDFYRGGLYLFAYAWGMGTVFIVAALVYGKGRRLFQHSAWTRWVKKGLGLLFFAMSLYYGIIFGKGLIHTYLPQTAVAERVEGWYTDYDAAVLEAQETGKPLVLDFRADWCAPCLEMEHSTFQDAEVKQLLSEHWIAVRIDCTQSNAQCDRLVEQWRIVGFPAIWFLDFQENPISDLIWQGGYLSARDLAQRLKRANAYKRQTKE